MMKKMNNYQKIMNMKQNEGAPDCWCPLPWSHINIKSNGIYKLCDYSNSSINRGTLRTKNGNPISISEKSDWNDAMNSDTMRSVRKNMLAGKWSLECARCQKEFNSGMRAHNFYERGELAELIEPENYPSYLKAKELTKDDGTISLEDFPISFLNIRFGNLCNLKCAMCYPIDSSSWYQEYNTIWGHYFTENKELTPLMNDSNKKISDEKNNIFDWSDNQHLWLQIKNHIQQFRKIYIVGGEPLLMKSYYKFLQWCIDNGAAEKLIIEFSSNMTHIPPKLYELWKYFKNIYFGISLDGFGEINNFIRYPSNWNRIEKNISQLDKIEEKNMVLYITTSVSVLNIWHLPAFIEYLMKKNYSHIGRWQDMVVATHPVHKPHYLNINILEESFKEKIRTRFKNYKKKLLKYDWQSICGASRVGTWEEKITKAHKILDDYIRFMDQTHYQSEELVKWRIHFIYFMDKLDQVRKLCWRENFPELYESTLNWRNLR